MPATVPADPNVSLFAPAWRNLSIGAIGLCSMMAFEAMGVATGMPVVAGALDGMSLYALAFASTLAGTVVAMVWSGPDCDRHGPYRSMAGGLVLFAGGLLLAGLAGSMHLLVLGRVVQGLGIGALGVALYVATAQAIPPSLHPRLFALFSSAWVLPAVIGPAISGYVVESFGWRWLFLGIAVLLLPTAALILPPLHGARARDTAVAAGPPRRALSWALLATAGCMGLSLGAGVGSWAPLAVALALGALVPAARHLLPAGTLRLAHGLPAVIALRGLNASAFFLCEAFVPLWLHEQRGWSITAAGLALTGGALAWSAGSHLQSRIRNDAKRQDWLRHGCLVLSLGIAVCGATVLGWLPEGMLLVGWSMAGLGTGISLPMLGVLTLKLAPRAQQGTYSSALQLCAALSTCAALAAGGVAFAELRGHSPTMAYVAVFLMSAGASTLAWIGAPRTTSGLLGNARSPVPGEASERSTPGLAEAA